MERLLKYFTEGVVDYEIGESVGMEVETSFTDRTYRPITVEWSQRLFRKFAERRGWRVGEVKGKLVTKIQDASGNILSYELGRQNVELATVPLTISTVVTYTRTILEDLYRVGEEIEVYPHFHPILDTQEELLVIPDERDAVWLKVDGSAALELLARISAVQFTIAVPLKEAVRCLNRLGERIGLFLKDYPQEEHWRRYIKESSSSFYYHPMRYGGPLFFKDLADYCKQLAKHNIVPERNVGLTPQFYPYSDDYEVNIPLFLRSIWWYFRLKRYGNTLCIEVRPLARRTDRMLQQQLDMVMSILL